jgi:hypothetical protein
MVSKSPLFNDVRPLALTFTNFGPLSGIRGHFDEFFCPELDAASQNQ